MPNKTYEDIVENVTANTAQNRFAAVAARTTAIAVRAAARIIEENNVYCVFFKSNLIYVDASLCKRVYVF